MSRWNLSATQQTEARLESIVDAARTLCEQASMLTSECKEPIPDPDTVADLVDRVEQAVRDMEGKL